MDTELGSNQSTIQQSHSEGHGSESANQEFHDMGGSISNESARILLEESLKRGSISLAEANALAKADGLESFSQATPKTEFEQFYDKSFAPAAELKDYDFSSFNHSNSNSDNSKSVDLMARQTFHAAEFSPEAGKSFYTEVSEANKRIQNLDNTQLKNWVSSEKQKLIPEFGSEIAVNEKLQKVSRFLDTVDKKQPGAKDVLLNTNGVWSALNVRTLIYHIEGLEARYGRKY